MATDWHTDAKRDALTARTFAWNAGLFRRVYRVTVRDCDYHLKHGWVRLGRPCWPWLSVKDCPIVVRWD